GAPTACRLKVNVVPNCCDCATFGIMLALLFDSTRSSSRSVSDMPAVLVSGPHVRCIRTSSATSFCTSTDGEEGLLCATALSTLNRTKGTTINQRFITAV